jgi:hypothetical protein
MTKDAIHPRSGERAILACFLNNKASRKYQGQISITAHQQKIRTLLIPPLSGIGHLLILILKFDSQTEYEIKVVRFGHRAIGFGLRILGPIPDKRYIKIEPIR